ncbi:hypothetical protein [Kribbella flavida]|nr:hypothetical protein [Kribbella flavida]
MADERPGEASFEVLAPFFAPDVVVTRRKVCRTAVRGAGTTA